MFSLKHVANYVPVVQSGTASHNHRMDPHPLVFSDLGCACVGGKSWCYGVMVSMPGAESTGAPGTAAHGSAGLTAQCRSKCNTRVWGCGSRPQFSDKGVLAQREGGVRTKLAKPKREPPGFQAALFGLVAFAMLSALPALEGEEAPKSGHGGDAGKASKVSMSLDFRFRFALTLFPAAGAS
uniref:Uncharacterized protein n=1 Tax=Eutreptiella gymnastica TaxID=73025 RepID=A0A7S4CPX2_9EUGL